MLGICGGNIVVCVAPEMAQQGQRPRRHDHLRDRAERSARKLRSTKRKQLSDLRLLAQCPPGYGLRVPPRQLGGGHNIGRHSDIRAVTEHRDGSSLPLIGNDTAKRQYPTHRPTGRAQSTQLDIQRHRGQRTRQRFGETGRAEDREPLVDTVVELSLQPFWSRAAQGFPWEGTDRGGASTGSAS